MLKLSDIASVSSGHPFRGAISPAEDGNGCVIQMKDVEPNMPIDWGQIIRTKIIGRGEPNWVNNNDLIFIARGRHNFSTCLTNIPANTVCSPHFFIIRVHDENYLPAFISWQINQRPIQGYFDRSATGTAQRNITATVLKEVQILPAAREIQEDIIQLQSLYVRERQLYLALMKNREMQLESVAHRILEGESGEVVS